MYSVEEIENWLKEQTKTMMEHQIPPMSIVIIRQLLAERSQIRRQAFEEAAEIADYGYDGYGKNLPSTRAICMTIADMIRCKAEEE